MSGQSHQITHDTIKTYVRGLPPAMRDKFYARRKALREEMSGPTLWITWDDPEFLVRCLKLAIDLHAEVNAQVNRWGSG